MRKLPIILFVITFLCCLPGCAGDEGYEEIKTRAVSILEQNQTELKAIATEVIENSGVPESVGMDGVTHIRYDDADGCVIFDLDAQGLLGGQYWSLIYTPDGTYKEQSQKYSWYEEDGNNIVIAEKVKEHWFFLWEDYDGREDLLGEGNVPPPEDFGGGYCICPPG